MVFSHKLYLDGDAHFRGNVYVGDSAKRLLTEDDLQGIGGAIIDVIALPETDIREDCFYRLLTGRFVYNQYVYNHWIVHCVVEFPEIGEPAISGDMSDLTNVANYVVTAYYNVTSGEVQAYVPEELAPAFGIPAGWYPAAVLLAAVGSQFSGVITNIIDDPKDSTYRLLLEYVTYSYKDGWTSTKTIGWGGGGFNAEVFNKNSNIASGMYSHAEGSDTTASGYASHAEGAGTEASGDRAHAEGDGTTASGHYSHAEGGETTASGTSSHAEGCGTTANSRAQHVQGEYNIPDPDGDPDDLYTRGRYAHIVGNGEIGNPSNAHTLDWDGNAWFAGNVYVGGDNQDNAKRLLTEDDLSNVGGTTIQFITWEDDD